MIALLINTNNTTNKIKYPSSSSNFRKNVYVYVSITVLVTDFTKNKKIKI